MYLHNCIHSSLFCQISLFPFTSLSTPPLPPSFHCSCTVSMMNSWMLNTGHMGRKETHTKCQISSSKAQIFEKGKANDHMKMPSPVALALMLLAFGFCHTVGPTCSSLLQQQPLLPFQQL
jgi:hypothetical protein